MSVEIVFEIGGRTVSPDESENALQKAILEMVQDGIVECAGSMRCPKHGTAAKIVASGKSMGELSLSVEACCDAFGRLVEAKLKK